MQCAALISHFLGTAPDGMTEMFDRWYYVLIFIGAMIGIPVAIKFLREPKEPSRRLLPDPLKVENVDNDFVTQTQMKEALKVTKKEMDERFARAEKDIGQRFEHAETVFRDRFHKLDNDMQGIKSDATDWHESASEQFQKIEGKLGELKSTSEHTNALAIRTDQAIRSLASELPKQIADATRRRA